MARRKESIDPLGIRIVGGRYRGRKLLYGGDRRVRPMKDRVREALFNLIGPSVRGVHAVDLFAGTGALALESLSRGASRATFIERHLPTATILRKNIATLQAEPLCQVVQADTFFWSRQTPDLGPIPWLVFSSPPYDFYIDRETEMLALLEGLIEAAPPLSIFAVESDTRFDLGRLPRADAWKVRTYPPAVVALLRVVDKELTQL